MQIDSIIKDVRKQSGLTQEEMAERLFVTRQAVSRWENGETTPNIETLKLLSKEFGIPASRLLGLSAEPICQSCGMDLKTLDDFGTASDGGVHTDYCKYCVTKGEFTNARTLDEMIESNLRFLGEYNKEKGLSFTPEQARVELKKHLVTLKRWKNT